MSTDAYRKALKQVLDLTSEEQLELLEQVISVVRHGDKEQHQHNTMEFKGIAKEAWKGVDVAKYIADERDSWER